MCLEPNERPYFPTLLLWCRSMYAGTFPEKVDRLILLEGGAPLTLEPAKTPDQLRDHIQATVRMRTGRDGNKVYASLEEMRQRMLDRPLTPAAADHLLEYGAEPLPDGIGWRFTHDRYLRVPSPFRMTNEHVFAFLRRVKSPTLMVMATHGWPFPAELVDGAEQALRECNENSVTRLTVPGSHHVHLEEPEIVAKHVTAFLSQ